MLPYFSTTPRLLWALYKGAIMLRKGNNSYNKTVIRFFLKDCVHFEAIIYELGIRMAGRYANSLFLFLPLHSRKTSSHRLGRADYSASAWPSACLITRTCCSRALLSWPLMSHVTLPYSSQQERTQRPVALQRIVTDSFLLTPSIDPAFINPTTSLASEPLTSPYFRVTIRALVVIWRKSKD